MAEDDRGPLLLELDGGRPSAAAGLAVHGLAVASVALLLVALLAGPADLAWLAAARLVPSWAAAPRATLVGLASALACAMVALDVRRLGRAGRADVHERAVTLHRPLGARSIPWDQVVGHRPRDGFVELRVRGAWVPGRLAGRTLPTPTDADRERVLALLDRLGVPCR